MQELPNHLGGWQHIENGPLKEGDMWVWQGKFLYPVDINMWSCAEQAQRIYAADGYHIYRKCSVPRHVDDKLPPVAETKPTNPKDMIGSNKIPLHLWPTTASALGSLALLDGMLKYGRTNYRAIGVRSSIYYDACMRHVNAWFEGEDLDPDSGLPHLSHALACIAVIVDAEAAGKLNDDRVFPGKYREFMERYTGHVVRLKEKHKDKSPKHYTIQTNKEKNEDV